MKVNAYVRESGDMGCTYHVPFDKYKWTGRWKLYSVVEDTPPGYEGEKIIKRTLSFERRFGIFPFNLFLKIWESEKNIVFIEEETTINTCASNELV